MPMSLKHQMRTMRLQTAKSQRSQGVSLTEHTKKVPLCEDVPDRMVIIGKGLEEAEEARLIQFLRNNQDVFAWSSSDLRGVSREVIEMNSG